METGTRIKVTMKVETKATKYKLHTTSDIIFPIGKTNGDNYERPKFVLQQIVFWFLKRFWEEKIKQGLEPCLTQLDAFFIALKYDKGEGIRLLNGLIKRR